MIGGDTRRDTHALQMRSPAGVVIAATTISNDAAGYAAAASWIDITPRDRGCWSV